MSVVAAIGLAAGGVTGCGGDDVAKSAVAGPSKGTFVNGSSPEEYCSVLESAKASLGTDIEAGDDAVLAAIHTINDIEPLAPVEAQEDWSGMQLIMQAVVDADGSDNIGTMSRAEAGDVYDELSGQLSESVAEICGFPLS
jgi:hypothetical protein